MMNTHKRTYYSLNRAIYTVRHQRKICVGCVRALLRLTRLANAVASID